MNSHSKILRACYSFMVPVARFLLRSGVTFKEFADVAKLAFVEVATQDYGIRGRPTNISRVSAMTGIGRKEVRRVRSAQIESVDQLQFNPLADVLHRWHTDPRFLDEAGKPKDLALHGAGSFSELVRLSAGDLPAGAVKVELIRCGAVCEDDAGTLRTIRRHVIPSDHEDNLAYRLNEALSSLASTIAFNSDGNNPNRGEGRIERVVFSDRIPDAALGELVPLLRDRIADFTVNIDDLLSDFEADAVPTPSRKIGVGVYYFERDDLA